MSEYGKNLQAYRELLHSIVESCHDLDTLDLVYKIIVATPPRLQVMEIRATEERRKAA